MADYGRRMTEDDWDDWYDQHEDEVREDIALGDRDPRGRWIPNPEDP